MYPGFQGLTTLLLVYKTSYMYPGNQGTHDKLTRSPWFDMLILLQLKNEVIISQIWIELENPECSITFKKNFHIWSKKLLLFINIHLDLKVHSKFSKNSNLFFNTANHVLVENLIKWTQHKIFQKIHWKEPGKPASWSWCC